MMPAHVSLVTAISERRTKKTILLQIFHRNQILLRASAPPRCNWFSPVFLRVSVPPWWVLGLVVALLRRDAVRRGRAPGPAHHCLRSFRLRRCPGGIGRSQPR